MKDLLITIILTTPTRITHLEVVSEVVHGGASLHPCVEDHLIILEGLLLHSVGVEVTLMKVIEAAAVVLLLEVLLAVVVEEPPLHPCQLKLLFGTPDYLL